MSQMKKAPVTGPPTLFLVLRRLPTALLLSLIVLVILGLLVRILVLVVLAALLLLLVFILILIGHVSFFLFIVISYPPDMGMDSLVTSAVAMLKFPSERSGAMSPGFSF